MADRQGRSLRLRRWSRTAGHANLWTSHGGNPDAKAVGRGLTGLRLGPTRQFPVWPDEVASVAVRETLQIILMLGLSLPEGTGGGYFRHHLARPQARSVDVGDGVFCDALLFVVHVEDGRPITGAYVVALPVARGGIMDLEEEFDQRAIARDRRVESELDRLRVGPVIVVGGVRNVAAGIAGAS